MKIRNKLAVIAFAITVLILSPCMKADAEEDVDRSDPYNWTTESTDFTIDGVRYFVFAGRWNVSIADAVTPKADIVVPDTINSASVESVSVSTNAVCAVNSITVGKNVTQLNLKGRKAVAVVKPNQIVFRGTPVSVSGTWVLAENGKIYVTEETAMMQFLEKYKPINNQRPYISVCGDDDQLVSLEEKNEWIPYFCVGMPDKVQKEFVVEENGLVYGVSENSAELCMRTSAGETEITVPDTVSGKPVTAISDRAFYVGGGYLPLESCSIPSTIVSIGEYAFDGYHKMNTFIIRGESQLVTIGKNAFFGVPFAEYFGVESKRGTAERGSILIPDSVEEIGNSAFANHTGTDGTAVYNSVYIPKGVKTIGNYAFGTGYWLRKVEIEAGANTVIEAYAFGNSDTTQENRTSALESLVIGEGATVTIKENAFRNVTINLKTVKIPATSTVEANAFPVPADGSNSSVTASCTVNFDVKEGTDVEPKTVAYATALGIEGLPVTSRDGYDFKGWYVDEDYTELYDAEWMITSDMTLYAKWEKKAEVIKPEDDEQGVDKPKDPTPSGGKTDTDIIAAKTGDSSNLVLWIVLVLVSVLMVRRKRYSK